MIGPPLLQLIRPEKFSLAILRLACFRLFSFRFPLTFGLTIVTSKLLATGVASRLVSCAEAISLCFGNEDVFGA